MGFYHLPPPRWSPTQHTRVWLHYTRVRLENVLSQTVVTHPMHHYNIILLQVITTIITVCITRRIRDDDVRPKIQLWRKTRDIGTMRAIPKETTNVRLNKTK